jgi:hypothetical protein
MSAAPITRPRRNPAGRKLLIACLASFAALLLFLGSIGIWARLVLLNTDEWVETAELVHDDEEIRAAVTQYAIDELEKVVDLDSLPLDSLPPAAQALALPMGELSRSYLRGVISSILDTDQFRTIWVGANEQAHTTFVAVVRDQSEVVDVENGEIVLDLHALLEEVKAQTIGSGGSFLADIAIPEDIGELTVADSDQIDMASTGIDLLDTLAPLIVLAAFVMFGVAIAISKVRWKTIITVGVMTGGVAVLILVSLWFGSRIIDAFVVDDVYGDASTALFGIATRQLRTESYIFLFVALVLGGIGFALGPMGFGGARRTGETATGSFGGGAGAPDPTAVMASSPPIAPAPPQPSPTTPSPGRPPGPPPGSPRPPPAYPPG